MNKEIFAGKWDQMKGKVKEQWGKLTDDDLTRINGKREQLIGKLKEKYGWAMDRAEQELSKFEKSWDSSWSESNDTDFNEGSTRPQKNQNNFAKSSQNSKNQNRK